TFTIFAELGIPVGRIVVGGGGATSPLWRQIQADVYRQPVETVAVDEGAAFGAAILAGVGARLWPTVDDACEAVVHSGGTTRVQADASAVMEHRYAAYRRIYPALRLVERGARSEAYA